MTKLAEIADQPDKITAAIAAEIALKAAMATDPMFVWASTAKLHAVANNALRGLSRAELHTVFAAVKWDDPPTQEGEDHGHQVPLHRHHRRDRRVPALR